MAPDVETIERATVDGVAPSRLEELPGWLLPLDVGEVNRAISAVPLHHRAHAPSILPVIIERYRALGLTPQLRLADVPELSVLQASLAASAFEPRLPTCVQLIETARLSALANDAAVTLAPAADADWSAVFHTVALSHGPPAERAARLARVATTQYATLRVGSLPVAVGALTFAYGLACVHSMRTTEAQRGRGHAQRIVGALCQAAQARGVQHMFLQVEEENLAARALYAKLGFSTLWRYRYWRQGGQPSAT